MLVMLTLSLLVGGALADAAVHKSPCTTCRGPQWMWDEFPAFFHGSDPNETAGGGFAQAALATIARFPIVTLEKFNGKAQASRHDQDAITRADQQDDLNPSERERARQGAGATADIRVPLWAPEFWGRTWIRRV